MAWLASFPFCQCDAITHSAEIFEDSAIVVETEKEKKGERKREREKKKGEEKKETRRGGSGLW